MGMSSEIASQSFIVVFFDYHLYCSMSPICAVFAAHLTASDASSLGRLEYTMLSQQAQMQIFVRGLDKAFRKSLQDPSGAFLDVCDWPAFRCDTDTFYPSWQYSQNNGCTTMA